MTFKSFGFAAAVLVLATSGSIAQSEAERRNAVGFSNGTVLLEAGEDYGALGPKWIAMGLIDEDSAVGWASAGGTPLPHGFSFELPQAYLLDGVEFDNRQTEEAGYPGISARAVTVEGSTTSRDGPWEVLATGAIDAGAVSEFPLDPPVAARWLRLTITGNGGRSDYTELMEFSAYGMPQGSRSPIESMAGTYATNWGELFVSADGGTITGCYDRNDGRIEGVLENGFLKVTWRETTGQEGDAVLAVTERGEAMSGFWSFAGSVQGVWSGALVPGAAAPDCAAELAAE